MKVYEHMDRDGRAYAYSKAPNNNDALKSEIMNNLDLDPYKVFVGRLSNRKMPNVEHMHECVYQYDPDRKVVKGVLGARKDSPPGRANPPPDRYAQADFSIVRDEFFPARETKLGGYDVVVPAAGISVLNPAIIRHINHSEDYATNVFNVFVPSVMGRYAPVSTSLGGDSAEAAQARAVDLTACKNHGHIGKKGFANFANVQKIEFAPDMLNLKIDDGAFEGLPALKELELPENQFFYGKFSPTWQRSVDKNKFLGIPTGSDTVQQFGPLEKLELADPAEIQRQLDNMGVGRGVMVKCGGCIIKEAGSTVKQTFDKYARGIMPDDINGDRIQILNQAAAKLFENAPDADITPDRLAAKVNGRFESFAAARDRTQEHWLNADHISVHRDEPTGDGIWSDRFSDRTNAQYIKDYITEKDVAETRRFYDCLEGYIMKDVEMRKNSRKIQRQINKVEEREQSERQKAEHDRQRGIEKEREAEQMKKNDKQKADNQKEAAMHDMKAIGATSKDDIIDIIDDPFIGGKANVGTPSGSLVYDQTDIETMISEDSMVFKQVEHSSESENSRESLSLTELNNEYVLRPVGRMNSKRSKPISKPGADKEEENPMLNDKACRSGPEHMH